MLISSAPELKLQALLNELRQHLNPAHARSGRAALRDRTISPPQPSKTSKPIRGLKRSLAARRRKGSASASSPDGRPVSHRACQKDSPAPHKVGKVVNVCWNGFCSSVTTAYYMSMQSTRGRSVQRSASDSSLPSATALQLDSKFSNEQVEIIRRVMKGDNVFFSGPAGTGKTLVLKVNMLAPS